MEQLTFSMKNNKRKGEGLELTTKPPHEYLCVNFPPPPPPCWGKKLSPTMQSLSTRT